MAKFQKGKSGNPGGRPKTIGYLQDAARVYTDKAITTLANIMEDEAAPHAARAMAADRLLDRGYGKASQFVEVAGDPDKPLKVEMSELEAARRLAFLMTKAAADAA